MNELFLILISMLPNGTVVDRVDVLESNVVYCAETGNDKLAQWIYWDMNERWIANRKTTDFFVVAWRLQKDAPIPRRDGALWVQEWYDKNDRVVRRIEARDFWQRDLPYDAEMRDQDRLPVAKRRGLTK